MMLLCNTFLFLIVCFVQVLFCDKLTNDVLENYSIFFNFGEKKPTKLDKTKLENDVIKSKVDVLGGVFKKNIDTLKGFGKLDIVFLIDASSSVGENNFKSEIKFVKKLLSDVTVDFDHTRIAIITFSSKNNVLKSVDEITEPRKENNKCLLLNKELGGIKYLGGGTYTLGAFRLANEIFGKSRNDSQKVLFLITDGYSNGGDPLPVAEKLKKNNVTIFTIGIRNGNYKELYELSSPPGEFYSYLLDSFQEFEGLARRALHVDIQSGDYIPLGTSKPCNQLCDSNNCCDKNALCTCGTSTGHYTCLCQPGYYGSGLQNSCSPCPTGTYADGPNLCLPCPDIHHITVPPANTIESCTCKRGYRSTKMHGCEIITCPKLNPPEHGYFVKRKECGNVLNNACGVRCEVGYSLLGDSIRLCEVSGNWSGNPPVCRVKTCSKLPIPQHGTISCSHEDLQITYKENETQLPVDTTCKFTCESGRILIGSAQRTCLPLAQWDGLKTSCKLIKCSKLSNIQYGTIGPISCTISKQSFGSTCVYSCKKGYKLIGPAKRSCTGKQGSWDSKPGLTKCEDLVPPVIECPEDIMGYTNLGQSYGTVFWDKPIVTDNSGLNTTVWIKPAITNAKNFKFAIGKTSITYFAQDAFGNTASCSFVVVILDNEPPIIENCIDPVTFLADDKIGANITWDEPEIYDNSGNVTVERSRDFGFFNIGLTQITYVGRDSSNNTNVCILNITVQESHCEPLPDPIFGHSECTSMSNGIQCVVTCQEGYAIPVSAPLDTINIDNSSTQFTCQHSDPVWYSEENSLFPDCTITKIPTEILQKGVITLQPQSEADICKDTTELNEIENEIQVTLNQNLLETCVSGVSCNIQTTTTCENLTTSQYEEQTNIIKRDILSTNKHRKINIEFEVFAKIHNDTNRNISVNSFQKLQIESFPIRNSKISIIKVEVEPPRVVCPSGFVKRKMRCVQCPKGTFHNTTKGACQSCGLGYYNDKVAQSSCTICPFNHSTSRMYCKSIKDCRAHCPPGTHARRRKLKPSKHHPNSTIEHLTLVPRCRPCPIGYYQANYGQLSCRPCPSGHTTASAKSTNIYQCIATARQFCDKGENICNMGICISSNVFYYSCNCRRNYIGSHCETKINHCLSQPCLNNGTCTSREYGFSCTCKDGYTGKVCEEIEETCDKKCYNGGKCVKNDFEEICLCPEGIGGESCEIKLQFCKENLCENHGKCIEQFDGFKCICENGHIGRRCNILPCDYRPCPSYTICSNINHKNATKYSYTCQCPKGYHGITCNEKIDYCKVNPCFNKGVCKNVDDDFVCECPKIFYGRKCQHRRNSDFILSFPRSGTTDFLKIDGFTGSLSEISVCLWVQTADSFNYGTILSYATNDYDNAFTLTDYTGLVLYINGKNVITDVFLNDGNWHFFCMTWQSINGTYNIYLDGKRAQNGTGLASETTIKGGGKLVIGQEQDVLGGKFSQSESFLGKMAYLDVWKKALRSSQIEEFMNSCFNDVYGDLYAWAEVRDFVQGDVEILNSTFCKLCPAPTPIKNGLVQIKNNVAYYKCNPGYSIDNTKWTNGRRCTKSSKWEGIQEPMCQRIYCGYPGYIKHGRIVGNGYYYLDIIKYECLDGYTMVGTNTSTCKENRQWSSDKPQCLGVQCQRFIKPDNSDIVIITDLFDEDLEDNANYDVGTQIEIVCTSDSKLEGENVITCLDNGQWSFPIPTCIKVEVTSKRSLIVCPVEQMPQPPTNGYVVLDTLYAYSNATTSIVEFECRQGYKPRGDNFTMCIVDGYWTEVDFSCNPINCDKPPLLTNMIIKDKSLLNKTHSFGNMISYECVEGYRMFGNNVLRCLANGRWTKMLGRCIRQSCFKPVVKETTLIEGNSYLYLDTVTLVCSEDQKYLITCSSSGKWVGDRGKDC